VDAKVERPTSERAVRWLLKEGLTSSLFKPAMAIGQALRPLVPGSLKDKVPPKAPPGAHDWPTRSRRDTSILQAGRPSSNCPVATAVWRHASWTSKPGG